MRPATLQLNSYFGPYFLEKLIAIGGMAEIYLARTRGLAGFEKQLVLKVIQPDMADDNQFVQMLVDEAKIAVGLNHPNIAQTFDLGKIGNNYFISMEYVDGADFFQILRSLSEMDVDLPIEAAIFVVHGALEGLNYAHNKTDPQGNPLRIIHRDISPQNILLSRYGEIKIVDFGIAKAANLSHKTRAGVIKGKLVYMSPEQAWGESVDQRADIFSAGIVLYEALTMGSLYLEKNMARLLEKVRKADIDPPSSRRPGLSSELDAIVMKALAPKPEDRYQTAHEYAEVLMAYQRRLAPDYTEQHLGALVESVLAGEKPQLHDGAAKVNGLRSVSMEREDFALQGHSIIFSAEDLAESSPVLLSMPVRPEEIQGPVVGKLVSLEDASTQYALTDHFTLGRAGDLRLADARVSRRHALISRQSNGYLIEDLGSSTGTYINENKIEQPHQLQEGDVIRIGPFKLRFIIEPALPPTEDASVVVAQIVDQPLQGMGQPISQLAEQLIQEPALINQGARPQIGGNLPQHQELDRPEDMSLEAPMGAEAKVALAIGSENLTLEIGDRLLLCHSMSIGELRFDGETAAFVRRSDGYWLEPGSTDLGVFHNGHLITAPIRLMVGDKIRVGPIQVQFLA